MSVSERPDERRYTDLSWSEQIVAGRLARLYQDRPQAALLSRADVVEELCGEIGIPASALPSDWHEESQSRFRVVGVLNPRLFTDEYQLEHGIYVIKVRDQLRVFWEAFGSDRPEVRDIYQVFGYHDIVMTALGTQAELESLEGSFARSGFEVLRFRVAETLRYRGYATPPAEIPERGVQPELEEAANIAAADYRRALEQPGVKPLIKRLEDHKLLLGPAVLETVEWTGRAKAWVAIRFSSGTTRPKRLNFPQLLTELPTLQRSLLSLFRLEPEESDNFSYLAELACDTFGHLDIATDEIIYAGIDLETLTLPVTKADDRGWRMNASGATRLSPGFGRVWPKLNRVQKRRLTSGEVPPAVVAVLEDALRTVYAEVAAPDEGAAGDASKDFDGFASRFARATLDDDLNALRSVHSDVVTLVEVRLRSTVEAVAGGSFDGSLSNMATSLGLSPEEPPTWSHLQSLLNQWVAQADEKRQSTDDEWQDVSRVMDGLRASRNRRFHGLDQTEGHALNRVVFEVAAILEDSAVCVRGLERLLAGPQSKKNSPYS